MGSKPRPLATPPAEDSYEPQHPALDERHGKNSGRSRVLIVDDQLLFADAIRSAMEILDMVLLPVARDGYQALRMVGHGRPDLALIDIGLTDMDGISVGKRIALERPETKLVVLTALLDQETVMAAAIAGFHGYLTKDISVPELVHSVVAVLEGQYVFPEGVAPRAMTNGNGHERGDELVVKAPEMVVRNLTARELQILAMLVDGVNGEEISRRLYLSPHTVRTHIQSVLAKLQVHSRLEAAAFALRHGLITPATRAR